MILALISTIIGLLRRVISYIPSTIYDVLISRTLTTYSYERLFLQIAKRFQKKKRILDIGVGTGVPLFTQRGLLPQNSEVLGIDIDESYILKAQRLFEGIPGITMQKLNFYQLNPQTHGKFDLVIFSSSFMLMPFREKALELAKSLLTPGGAIYFILTLQP